MQCAKCHHDNPADALFCMKCGTKLENRCTSCKTLNPVEANFCLRCGTALRTTAANSTASAKPPRVELAPEEGAGERLEGERKRVTALFADIKGSMELMQDLDPEE